MRLLVHTAYTVSYSVLYMSNVDFISASAKYCANSCIFGQYFKIHVTNMNNTDEYFFFLLFEKHQYLSVHVNDWPFWINGCTKVLLIVRLCANCIVSNSQWIVILCNWFFIGVNDRPLREIESIFVVFVCPKVQLFIRWCYWMLIYMQIAFLKVYLLSLIDRRCNCSSVDAKKNLGPRRGIGTMRGLYSSD